MMIRNYCPSALLNLSSRIGCYLFCGFICTASLTQNGFLSISMYFQLKQQKNHPAPIRFLLLLSAHRARCVVAHRQILCNPCSKLYSFSWQMSLRANVFFGKFRSGHISFLANVSLVKCPFGQTSSWQMYFGSNVFKGKRLIGKCPS
jgi:hypothetical protein